jgi:RND family efflux transporter MFP subunit
MRLKSDKGQFSSLLATLALAVAFPLALTACSDQKAEIQQLRPVKAMVVASPVSERTLTYSGVLVPRIESTLGFRVSGKVVERYVNAGDQVAAGQKIARLDDKDLKLAENSARAAVTSAKTRFDVAKDALERANYLLPNGFIARSAVDQRQLEYDSALSALNAAKDQLNQAINATSYALLFADSDGLVTSVRAEPGQVVGVGQAVITLAHAEDIEVLVAVPEQEIAKLSTGDRAFVALWAEANINSPGKIREIAGTADAGSRTYAVRVKIERRVPEMRLGMTTSVAFRVPEKDPGIIVPLAALAEDKGKTVAYVADRSAQTVVRREVETEGVTDAGVRIVSGLKPGDILVTGGVQFLHDGMRVRLPKEVLTSVAETATAQR